MAGFAARLAKWLVRLAWRVRIGQFDVDVIGAIDKGATVVFVMNHRSHRDCVPVTCLAASRPALAHAVGEWALIGFHAAAVDQHFAAYAASEPPEYQVKRSNGGTIKT